MDESPVSKNVQMRVQLMFPDIHTKEFQCPICAKYFSRKFTLDAHMLIHKGEKPYACPFCGRCFRQKGTLMRHKALHSSKNLFHCSLCNRGFRQKNVFIHHLRHRHDVSVETLDRRKYRTELKDYQSIMDTLPSFVHADSTAIASSEKHFDALLFESIKKPVNDSDRVLQEDVLTKSSLQSTQTTVSDKSSNTDNITHTENVNLSFNECDNLRLKVNLNQSEYNQHYKEESINPGHFEDRKPVINNNLIEVDTIISSAKLSNSNTFVTDTRNLLHSQSVNVTSSNNINDENLICIPCQCSFTSEAEFKCHVKTHVQSVLLTDINSEDPRSANLQKACDAESCIQFKEGLSVPISPFCSKSFNGHVDAPNSNVRDEINVPVKVEIFDSEVEACLSSNQNNFELSMTSLPKSNLTGSKLKCPVCKVFLQGEKAFMKHSKKHDSFSLLKLIYESLESQSSRFSTVSSEKHFPNRHGKNCIKPLLRKVLKTGPQSKKYITKVKKCSKKKVSATKTLICMQCNIKFSNRLLFEYHQQLHLSTKGFFCKCCRKSFSSKKLLLSHMRIYHLKTFTCSKCSRIFNYRKLFKSHQERCKAYAEVKTSNGSNINFPVVNIESLLSSNVDGIIGIIPICGSSLGEIKNGVKIGIPVMSVSQINTLHTQQPFNSLKINNW